MNIYIRSQDKLQLEKMERIAFTPLSEFDYSTGTSINANEGIIFVNNHEFGKYTREQALSIIGEIQLMLNSTVIDHELYRPKSYEEITIQYMYRTLQKKECIIYELPPAIQKDKE